MTNKIQNTIPKLMHGEHYWGVKVLWRNDDLLKLANAKHGDSATISKGPKSIDCSCLSNLHVYAGRVCCCRDWSTFPGGKNTELLYGHHRLYITVSKMILPSNLWPPTQNRPVCPHGGGSIKVGTCVNTLPLEDSLVLGRFSFQPNRVLADN